MQAGLSSSPNPGASETSIEPPCGTDSFRKRLPKTAAIDLPSAELAMSADEGEAVSFCVSKVETAAGRAHIRRTASGPDS